MRVVRKFESLASESPTLHAYLREIATFPSLTQDDEHRLGQQIQRGDEDALGRLVQANLRMVVTYAKRFRHLGVPLLDLIHEGNLALIEAARRFDPSKGSDFQASAMWWIRQAMLHLLAETGRTTDPEASGLLAAATQGRHVDALRVAVEYAQSAASGQEIKEPAITDVEDFAAHLQAEGRRKSRRRGRTQRASEAAALDVMRQHNVLRGYLN